MQALVKQVKPRNDIVEPKTRPFGVVAFRSRLARGVQHLEAHPSVLDRQADNDPGPVMEAYPMLKGIFHKRDQQHRLDQAIPVLLSDSDLAGNVDIVPKTQHLQLDIALQVSDL